MNKFVLIDGNSLINRGFYATPLLTTKDGVYTNAVYAFVNMLIKLSTDYAPDGMLVAFDLKEPTFRHKIFSDYKGTRKPMPDELRPQIDLLKRVLDALHIARYEKAGFEADDIIGTLAKKFAVDTLIVTGDRDSFQLVDETTTVLFTKRGITDIYELNAANFKEKREIDPDQVVDLKALMGDASDNIPGVAGIGEKTGIELIKKYGTLENVYDHIDEIKGKLREKLEDCKDSAFMSKTLATIKLDVDIPLTEDDMAFRFPFPSDAKNLFLELEFKNLLKKNEIFIPSVDNVYSPVVSLPTVDVKKVFVTSPDEITNFIKNNKIALSIKENICFYNYDGIEVTLKIKDNFFDDGFLFDEALIALKPILSDEKINVIVEDNKSFLHTLNSLGISPKAKTDDLSLLKYVVDYDDKSSELDLSEDFPAYKIAATFDHLFSRADKAELSLYKDIELPLSFVLFEMELSGFKIDVKTLDEMSLYYSDILKNLSKKIIEVAGVDFNINSTKQLSEVLFDKLGLKHGKKNKTGSYSTNVDILEDLADSHEIIPLLLEYRKYQKLYSTYVEGFKPLIDKNSSLVHTTFYQSQTTTGRLSSRKPNLQNIPVRDDEGKVLRKLFSARADDRILIDADYSQIELRLLAVYSKCQKMIDAFNSGKDFHAETASKVFGVPIEDVTPSMRKTAKAVNFGIIYGISDFGLADNLKISPKKAGEYIKKYFETYPEVRAFMDKNVSDARLNGYAVTAFGRKRIIREINAANYNLRSFGERAAMNMPLQGTAADVIKIAMINVFNRLKQEGLRSQLVLQVHDELIIDAFISEKQQVERIIKEEMENAVKLSVTLVAEVSSGKNWFDCK